MLTILTGFFASFSHVLTGPDHLAAVTPFSLELRKKSWIIGLSWGLGHTIGMLMIGFVFLLFKEFIPIELISRNSEVLVGFLLIIIGGWGLFRQFKPSSGNHHQHPHLHQNGKNYIHLHPHEHSGHDDANHSHQHRNPPRNAALSAMLIGTVHGLAGFSHLIAVLPSLTLPSHLQSVLFLASFGSGTIITMILYTFLLGAIAHKIEVKNRTRLLKWIGTTGGVIVILIGLFWIFLSF